MKKIEFQEAKLIQLEILKRFDEFCRSRNLRYSLGGGTLLGAVRHKGYIPWDDDIDVMMPRPDYEVFLKEWNSDHYLIRNAFNDNSFPYAFSKILDNKTLIIEAEGYKSSLFIDVFPIDGLPDTKADIEHFLKKLWRFNRRIRYTVKEDRAYRKYKFLAFLYRLFYRWDKSVKAYDEMLSFYPFETSKNAGAISGLYGDKEVMHADVFKHYIDLSFEGCFMMCIENYHDYLTQHYGDYMQLPPKDKQIAPHAYTAYVLD